MRLSRTPERDSGAKNGAFVTPVTNGLEERFERIPPTDWGGLRSALLISMFRGLC